MHPETVGRLKRRFEQQGMLGLLPDTVEVVPSGRQGRVKEAITSIEEITKVVAELASEDVEGAVLEAAE